MNKTFLISITGSTTYDEILIDPEYFIGGSRLYSTDGDNETSLNFSANGGANIDIVSTSSANITSSLGISNNKTTLLSVDSPNTTTNRIEVSNEPGDPFIKVNSLNSTTSEEGGLNVNFPTNLILFSTDITNTANIEISPSSINITDESSNASILTKAEYTTIEQTAQTTHFIDGSGKAFIYHEAGDNNFSSITYSIISQNESSILSQVYNTTNTSNMEISSIGVSSSTTDGNITLLNSINNAVGAIDISWSDATYTYQTYIDGLNGTKIITKNSGFENANINLADEAFSTSTYDTLSSGATYSQINQQPNQIQIISQDVNNLLSNIQYFKLDETSNIIEATGFEKTELIANSNSFGYTAYNLVSGSTTMLTFDNSPQIDLNVDDTSFSSNINMGATSISITTDNLIVSGFSSNVGDLVSIDNGGKLIAITPASGATAGSFGITIDGGGSAITTGVKGYVEIPYSGTITGWTILSDQTGSCVIDVWKDTYANYPPTVADTIAGSEKPTLSSAIKNQDLSLSTWTTSVTAGDIIAFNVDSASTVTRVTLTIKITKS